MAQLAPAGVLSVLRNRSYVFLAFFWVFGFAAGILFSIDADNVLSALMRGILSAPVSIVGLLLAAWLPFLLSAFAVYFHTLIWIFPIAACKAFLFGFVSMGLRSAADSAGWLLQLLFMAGDFLTVPLLYFYWLRSLSGRRHVFSWLLVFLVLGSLGVLQVNSRLVLPVFAELGNR